MVEQAPKFRTVDDSSDDAESEGLDLERIREMAGFVLRAARRRPKLVTTTFLSVAVLGLTVAATMPRIYTATVKVLAQRSSAIRVLSSSAPGMDSVDNPTKNVAAMILRRDNLVSLAKDANLVQRFEETRPAPLRFKDRIFASLFGQASERDKLLGMVGTLEDKLRVTTPDDATVVIAVDWSNPKIAYDLVTLVQKNFLEARYDSDVAVINDSIAVLEEHAKNELALVDAQLDEYQKIVASRAALIGPTPTPSRGVVGTQTRAPAGGLVVPAVDPELTKALEDKRLQIRSLEEGQQRTVDSLRQQLLQAQLTLTPMHPTVIALQQQIDALSQPPQQLTQLRSEERLLMSQIAQLAQPRAVPAATGLSAALQFRADSATDSDGGALSPTSPPVVLDRDGPLQLAQSRLASAIHAYQDAIGRIDAARVELDITRASYKHKYTVVSPAELPKAPKKSTAPIGIAAVLGGALLALLLAAGLDLLGGSILEPWQIRRRLKIEVLGEFDRPS